MSAKEIQSRMAVAAVQNLTPSSHVVNRKRVPVCISVGPTQSAEVRWFDRERVYRVYGGSIVVKASTARIASEKAQLLTR